MATRQNPFIQALGLILLVLGGVLFAGVALADCAQGSNPSLSIPTPGVIIGGALGVGLIAVGYRLFKGEWPH